MNIRRLKWKIYKKRDTILNDGITYHILYILFIIEKVNKVEYKLNVFRYKIFSKNQH